MAETVHSPIAGRQSDPEAGPPAQPGAAGSRGSARRVSVEQELEVAAQRKEHSQTLRACAPDMEERLYHYIPVLDHGFIRVIDYMGTDAAIVQAARVSYGRGTKTPSQDGRLIDYLMRHQHSTPFEMCEIKLHVKLPIFVARQWVRHRTASINEYSARYSILDREFYVPDRTHKEALKEMLRLDPEASASPQGEMFSKATKKTTLAQQSLTNKQGRGDAVARETFNQALQSLQTESNRAYTTYEKLLNERDGKAVDSNHHGLARELARMILPTNFYTQWYWKINLHNLMHFLALRADPHAQYEIRVYAEAMMDIFRCWTPLTYAAFMRHRRGGARLSATALDVVRRLLAGQEVSREESGLSPREWRELMAVLDRPEA